MRLIKRMIENKCVIFLRQFLHDYWKTLCFHDKVNFQPSTNSQGNSDVSVEDASDNDLNSRQSVVGITTDVTNSGTEVSNATDSSVAAQMLDIDAQLSFLPEMLEFQPDLAVNVMDALVNAENKR